MAREIIYFSRHGETDWNVAQRIQGQLDIDINAHGRTQADRNGDVLKSLIGDGAGFDFVASPLRRTHEDLIDARHHDKWNFVPPGAAAESYMQLSQRIGRWVEAVEWPTVCVTHGGCIRTLFFLYTDLDGHAAANLSIPQDKILKFENGTLEWV